MPYHTAAGSIGRRTVCGVRTIGSEQLPFLEQTQVDGLSFRRIDGSGRLTRHPDTGFPGASSPHADSRTPARPRVSLTGRFTLSFRQLAFIRRGITDNVIFVLREDDDGTTKPYRTN